MKARFYLALAVMLAAFTLRPRFATACGHDGFFLGAGYQQLFMYTTERSGTTLQKVAFGPGYGTNFLIGYDFEGSRWGVQLPFEYSNLRLNHQERTHYLGGLAEGIFHAAAWSNGIDINLVGGVGGAVLLEGNLKNNSASKGIIAGIGPGFNYFFVQSDSVRASFYLQTLIRMVHFFGNNLSHNGTTALSVPIRLGISIGF